MTEEQIRESYERWLARAGKDEDVAAELKAMREDGQARRDAFYRELTFGTGGLRGILGAGTNRMNIYTVARASRGLAAYVKQTAAGTPRIAVSFDSRIKSAEFARTAAGVFAAAGIEVYIYPELMPTPCLSFAVRRLNCTAGVMVTASHNPSKYNGYKVYGADGCQITGQAARTILKEIESEDYFDGAEPMPFADGLAAGQIRYIGEDVTAAFLEAVKAQSLTGRQELSLSVPIVYSPLNGTGYKPVLRALRESGYENITVVQEQAEPDGHFPTCPYPNPEQPEAMALGMAYARRVGAELLLATDPDCDRVGIAVPDETGAYTLLSGNETGLLLLDYICRRRQARGHLPKNAVCLKTIVTSELAGQIAARYGVRCQSVLTGFKYIGEQIGLLEEAGEEDSFILGFEESYGYLSGSYVRDKDGVGASLLICEMCAWYKKQGSSLWQRLTELYREYGYCLSTQRSYAFEGADGFRRMQELMGGLRAGRRLFQSGPAALSCADYAGGRDGLPPSDVLRFELEGGCSVVIRPSGTEPKLKAYISVRRQSRSEAEEIGRRIGADLDAYMQ